MTFIAAIRVVEQLCGQVAFLCYPFQAHPHELDAVVLAYESHLDVKRALRVPEVVDLLKAEHYHKALVISPIAVANLALLGITFEHPLLVLLCQEPYLAFLVCVRMNHHSDSGGEHRGSIVENRTILETGRYEYIQVQASLPVIVGVTENGICRFVPGKAVMAVEQVQGVVPHDYRPC